MPSTTNERGDDFNEDKENKESGQTEYTGLMEEGSLDAEVDEVAFDVSGESSPPVPPSPIWNLN